MKNNILKTIQKNILLLNIMLTVAFIHIGVVSVAFVCITTNNAAKIVEIAQKTNVECVAKTNTLFGVMTKIKLVK